MDIEEKLSDLIDDPDFRSVDRHRAKLNFFEAVGAVRGELRHSNFLAFLFSPNRSHGLGPQPLLNILRSVLNKLPREQRPLRPLELVVGDLDGAIVYREWNNIDLLIDIKELRLVVLIENKIDAKASEGQLTRYKKVIQDRFADRRQLLVFLTPDGTAPDESGYVSFSYAEVAKALEGLVDDTHTSPETSIIIRHYLEMLRRHIVPDEQLHELVRQLYERHKEAFDFIFENRPEPESLLEIARSLLNDEALFCHDRHGANILRFVPLPWLGVAKLNACDLGTWTKTGRNLLFEIKSWNADPYKDRIIVSLVSGPADSEIRNHLYQAAMAKPSLFKGLVKPMGKQNATIYLRELLSPTAARDMDLQEKAETIESNWLEFVDGDFPALTKEILNILQQE
ncbi:PD-(D/E)XK nuclease family protein [Parvibaculum sp.]|uniref:PD-(D/E)XK nuclease family protein n=1 Tax=Parvibaculum sp. TaxID=2024848 RepID=UPI0034A0558E